MTLLCQQYCIQDLKVFAEAKKHSIIISGNAGVGKTYLAKQYATLLNITDFQIIDPNVQAIRDAVIGCYQISNPIVLCIENLDTGVFAASSALLKFLEEPANHVYIVVTVRNLQCVQDTIISRSHLTSIGVPTEADLHLYAETKSKSTYEYYKQSPVWKCLKTFENIDTVLGMDYESLHYIESLPNSLKSMSSVSDIAWSLQKYPNNSPTPFPLVVSYIMSNYSMGSPIFLEGIHCLRDLSKKRMSPSAIVNKFSFVVKHAK